MAFSVIRLSWDYVASLRFPFLRGPSTTEKQTISEQLKRELPGLRGYSPSNMKNMRLFYEKWSVLDSKSPIAIGESSEQNSTIAIGELQSEDYQIDIYRYLSVDNVVDFPIEVFFSVPFTHHIRILEKTQTQAERYYYMHRCVMENLSVDGLVKIIKQDDFLHKSILPNNFVNTISDPATARKAVMMFKDEYFLDFINTEEIGERDFADIDEKVVEKEIIHNVKNFIMTFGRDFAFIGNQYHLEVYGHDHFPDLLFFNRELNAMVVVDLKKGEFKPSYLGQLAAYLRILDDKVRKPHENQTRGMDLIEVARQCPDLTVSIRLGDLIEANQSLVEEALMRLEKSVAESRTEIYLSRTKVMEMQEVASATLWRWEKCGYLVPLSVGGKKRYRRTDIQRLLNR